MTGPVDETRPIEEGLELSDPPFMHFADHDDEPAPVPPPDEDSAAAWQMLRDWRKELLEQPAPTSGVEAWRRVEALVDLALAERAQRTVDRIVARHLGGEPDGD